MWRSSFSVGMPTVTVGRFGAAVSTAGFFVVLGRFVSGLTVLGCYGGSGPQPGSAS
jgi:hypothetical protein